MGTKEKILGLLARTASSSMEEARTSAYIAAKLIREHSFVVLSPEEHSALRSRSGGYTSYSPPRPKPPPPPQPKKPPPPPPKPPPPKSSYAGPPPFSSRDDKPWDQGPPQVVIITAKYDSRCRFCGDDIEAGERVYWVRGKGCTCMKCPEPSVP